MWRGAGTRTRSTRTTDLSLNRNDPTYPNGPATSVGGAMRDYKLFIGGDMVDAASGESVETRDPSTGARVARVAKAAPEDMRRAVGAARAAFDEGPWPSMTPAERAGVMRRA